MIPESVNNIWGRTLNPLDNSRTCGGSSGGEGALVGCNSSPLGIGNDIGGSVWIPAVYCGVYGFKGGSKRSTLNGTVNFERVNEVTQGNLEIMTVTGPLSNSVEDCSIA